MSSSLELANVKVRISVDASGATEAFADVARSSSEAADIAEMKTMKVADAMKEVGEFATKYITKPVVEAFKTCVSSAADFTETLGKTDVVFGDMSDAVKEWSSSSIDSMGVAQSTALEMVSLFGDMATGMGITTNEAATMSMKMAQLAADLASFKNVSVDTASKALQGIFTGETQSLKQLGVVMNEATLNEYALAQGMTKTYSAMSNQEKVMLRYQYVMQATSSAQGDFARTGDSLSNQQKKLGESVKNVSTSFGSILEPAITKVVSVLNSVINWVNNTSTAFKTLVTGLAAAAAAVGPILTAFAAFQKLKTTSLFASLMSAGPYIAAIAAALAAVTTALIAVSKAAKQAKQDRMEAAKEVSKDLVSHFKETTTIEQVEDPNNETNVNNASARLKRYVNLLVTQGTIVQNNLGKYVFSSEITDSITTYGTALFDAVTATDGYAAKVDSLKSAISSLVSEAQSALAKTYALIVEQYILTASANGQSRDVIKQNVATMLEGYAQVKAEVEQLGTTLDENADIFGNGTAADDVGAFVDAVLGLDSALALTGVDAATAEEAVRNMLYLQEQGGTANIESALAYAQLAIGLLTSEADTAADAVTALFDEYTKGNEKAQQVAKDAPDILDAEIGKRQQLCEYLTQYESLLERGKSAEEAMAIVMETMTEDGVEGAQELGQEIQSMWEKAGETAGNQIDNMSHDIQQYYYETEIKEKAAQEMREKGYEQWSDETKQVYNDTLSEILGMEVTNGDAELALRQSLNEGLAQLQGNYSQENLDAVSAMFESQGIMMDAASLAMLQGQDEFWNAYNEAVGDGSELTQQELANLMDILSKTDGWGEDIELGVEPDTESAEEAGEVVVKTFEETVDNAEVEPEVSVKPEAEVDDTSLQEADEEIEKEASKPKKTRRRVTEVTDTEVVEGTTKTTRVKRNQPSKKGTENRVKVKAEVDNSSVDEAISQINEKVESAEPEPVKATLEIDESTIATQAQSAGQNFTSKIVSAIRSGRSKVASASRSLASGAKSTSTWSSNGRSCGSALGSGIVSGINSSKSSVISAANALGAAALSAFKKKFGIASPSKVFANEIGAPIDWGIAKGIEDNVATVNAAIDRVTSGIVTSGTAAVNNALAQKRIQPTTINQIGKQGGTTYITQNNTFTSKELSPYEQLIQTKKLNKQLAASFT